MMRHNTAATILTASVILYGTYPSNFQRRKVQINVKKIITKMAANKLGSQMSIPGISELTLEFSVLGYNSNDRLVMQKMMPEEQQQLGKKYFLYNRSIQTSVFLFFNIITTSKITGRESQKRIWIRQNTLSSMRKQSIANSKTISPKRLKGILAIAVLNLM